MTPSTSLKRPLQRSVSDPSIITSESKVKVDGETGCCSKCGYYFIELFSKKDAGSFGFSSEGWLSYTCKKTEKERLYSLENRSLYTITFVKNGFPVLTRTTKKHNCREIVEGKPKLW